jgi:hypothetical protein
MLAEKQDARKRWDATLWFGWTATAHNMKNRADSATLRPLISGVMQASDQAFLYFGGIVKSKSKLVWPWIHAWGWM